MIFELVQDFSAALAAMPADHPRHRILRLLEEALRRDVHFIARHPTTLFQCMWNTCWWYDCPEAAEHYVEPHGGWPGGEAAPPWIGSGERLHVAMDTWCAAKERTTPRFPWIRSLRPPPLHLDTPLQQVLAGHKGHVWGVGFSPDGKRIVSGSEDGTARLWDAVSGEELLRMTGHQGPVFAVAYSPDGRQIASGSADGTIRLWDTWNGSETACFRGHAGHVWSVAYSPDGSRIVSGADDDTVRIWDRESGAEVRSIPGGRSSPWTSEWSDGPMGKAVLDLAFSPDGRWVVAGMSDGRVRAWNAESGQEIGSCTNAHQSDAFAVAVSPDGKHIASGSGDRTVCLWPAPDHEGRIRQIREFRQSYDRAVWSVAFSPDGQWLAIGLTNGWVQVLDAQSGRESQCFEGHHERVPSVAYSPDGLRIASGSWDGTVCVWDAQSKVRNRRLEGHYRRVHCVRFSPDGTQVASGSRDTTVRVWDARHALVQRCLEGPGGFAYNGWVYDLAFSSDGQWIATASSLGTLRIWHVRSRPPYLRHDAHPDGVRAVAFSPDGRRVAFGSPDGALGIWHVGSSFWSRLRRLLFGAIVRSMRGHQGAVLSVAFSPDGRHIVSGGADRTVRIWSARRGSEVRRLQGHSNHVDAVAYSHDGQRIVSASAEAVRVWGAETGSCLEAIEDQPDTYACFTRLCSGSAWRARLTDLDTSIEPGDAGEPIAWFSARLAPIAVHPTAPTWAGADVSHLHIVTLEGLESDYDRQAAGGARRWHREVSAAQKTDQDGTGHPGPNPRVHAPVFAHGASFVEPDGWIRLRPDKPTTRGYFVSADSDPLQPKSLITVNIGRAVHPTPRDTASAVAAAWEGVVLDEPTTLDGVEALRIRVHCAGDFGRLRRLEGVVAVKHDLAYVIAGSAIGGRSVANEVEQVRQSWKWAERVNLFETAACRN